LQQYLIEVCADGMEQYPRKLECHAARNNLEAIGERRTDTQHFDALAIIGQFDDNFN